MRWLLMIFSALSISACTFFEENFVEYVIVIQGEQPEEVRLQFPDGISQAVKTENSFTVMKAFQESYATSIYLDFVEIEHVCTLNITDEPGFLQFILEIEDDRCMIVEERANNVTF